MQPANINLTIYKGSTFSKSFQWKTGSPSVPVNLTGCTARMQVRKSVNDTNIVDSLTTQNSRIVITEALNGKFEIYVPANVSSLYSFNGGVYDLEIVFPDSKVVRVIEGCFESVPEVTR